MMKPWLESEIDTLLQNLHLTIPQMINNGLFPGRTYWMIYNQLATTGYKYDFKKKRYY